MKLCCNNIIRVQSVAESNIWHNASSQQWQCFDNQCTDVQVRARHTVLTSVCVLCHVMQLTIDFHSYDGDWSNQIVCRKLYDRTICNYICVTPVTFDMCVCVCKCVRRWLQEQFISELGFSVNIKCKATFMFRCTATVFKSIIFTKWFTNAMSKISRGFVLYKWKRKRTTNKRVSSFRCRLKRNRCVVAGPIQPIIMNTYK